MEAKVGQIFNSIYYSIILLHILISVNRLCSISMPLKYMCIFGGKKSLLMALSMIAISAGFWFGSYFRKWFLICLKNLFEKNMPLNNLNIFIFQMSLLFVY